MNNSRFWYPSIVGFLAILLGLAFCRFSYTPMIPFFINQHWLGVNQANYVGSYNFLGYFVGAMLAFTASRYCQKRFLIRASLILVVVSLALCAWNQGFYWFAFWRFIAGVLGAFLVVLTPSIVMSYVDPKKSFYVSGIMFMGAGAGIILSSLIVPWLASISLNDMWLIFALFALVFVIIAWQLFSAKAAVVKAKVDDFVLEGRSKQILVLVAIGYFLCGIGVVPHTLFLSHYLHQDLHLSLASSGGLFALFGVGCLIGSFLGGVVAAKIGVYNSLFFTYVLGFIAVFMVPLTHSAVWVVLSAVLIGIYLFSCVNLTSLRVRELVAANHHPKYWGRVTLCFAIGQAVGAYGMSALVACGANYLDTFWLAAVALLVGLVALLCAK